MVVKIERQKLRDESLRDSLHTTSSNSLRSQELVITREMIEKAMKCKDANELIKLAESEGYEMTRDEAEAYIAELADFELDDATLKKAAGGGCGHCYCACDPDCVENWMPL